MKKSFHARRCRQDTKSFKMNTFKKPILLMLGVLFFIFILWSFRKAMKEADDTEAVETEAETIQNIDTKKDQLVNRESQFSSEQGGLDPQKTQAESFENTDSDFRELLTGQEGRYDEYGDQYSLIETENGEFEVILYDKENSAIHIEILPKLPWIEEKTDNILQVGMAAPFYKRRYDDHTEWPGYGGAGIL